VLDAGLEQIEGIAGIVGIIFERIGDRFRGHDGCGEMEDLPEAVLHEQGIQTRRIGKISHDQLFPMDECVGKPGREIIIDNHCIAGLAQLANHMAADITAASGDKNFLHEASLRQNRLCFLITVAQV